MSFGIIGEAAEGERQAAKQAGPPIAVSDEDRIRIEAALPAKAAGVARQAHAGS